MPSDITKVKVFIGGKEVKSNEEAIAAGVQFCLDPWAAKTADEVLDDMRECIRLIREAAEKPLPPTITLVYSGGKTDE